ncbi:Pre-mRNA polyadenylation factor Fip1 [Trinorchestia longiramus]|nr:Pre-mRNA polyadenylation factor Fip1 [Trinorchestia longiramus]
MAEVQDDDQWLYGEDGAEKAAAAAAAAEESASKAAASPGRSDAAPPEKTSVQDERKSSPGKEGDAAADKEGVGAEGDDAAADVSATDGDKSGDGAGAESSDEDDLTITIGELKKAAEVMTPGQQHVARFQPKAAPTTGLRDEDFASAGKVNGVAVPDLNSSDYEDKPWRKPGADLSDYFNYGFNEQTWFKYCDRQKRMRMNESGSGLNSLGINVGKPFGYPSSSDSKTNGADTNGSVNRPRPSGTFHRRIDSHTKPEGNSIQVMTADRRQYSNKVMAPPFMSGPPPPIPQGPYDDMDFGGSMFGPGPDNGYYSTSSYFNTPPPSGPPPPVSGPPPNFNAPPVSWSNPPPPMVPPPQMVPPATHDGPPPPRWGGEAPPPPALTGTLPMMSSSSPPPYRSDREREDSDEDRRRARRHRRTSRSPSRSRHRTRSRSRSPSHKHKRKKSKRDRDAD